MKNIFFGVFWFFSNSLAAQSIQPAVLTSGGQCLSFGGVSLAYAIGEIVTAPSNNSPGVSSGLLSVLHNNLQTGISKTPLLTQSFYLFPNPTYGKIYMSKAPAKPAKICIYDLTGRTMSGYTNNINGEIDISLLARGNYYIAFTDIDGTISQTFQIVKF